MASHNLPYITTLLTQLAIALAATGSSGAEEVGGVQPAGPATGYVVDCGIAADSDVIFTDEPVRNYRDVLKDDASVSTEFNRLLRNRGILKPAQKIYSSLSLTEDDIALTSDAIAFTVSRVTAQ